MGVTSKNPVVEGGPAKRGNRTTGSRGRGLEAIPFAEPIEGFPNRRAP